MLTKIMKGEAKIKINVIFSPPGLENNLFIPDACDYLSADSLAWPSRILVNGGGAGGFTV